MKSALMAIIRCLHYHPWSSVEEVAQRTRLIPDFVKRMIHSDVAYEKKTEGKGADKVVLYRLKDRSAEMPSKEES